jgi:hypothetical protein
MQKPTIGQAVKDIQRLKYKTRTQLNCYTAPDYPAGCRATPLITLVEK